MDKILVMSVRKNQEAEIVAGRKGVLVIIHSPALAGKIAMDMQADYVLAVCPEYGARGEKEMLVNLFNAGINTDIHCYYRDWPEYVEFCLMEIGELGARMRVSALLDSYMGREMGPPSEKHRKVSARLNKILLRLDDEWRKKNPPKPGDIVFMVSEGGKMYRFSDTGVWAPVEDGQE